MSKEYTEYTRRKQFSEPRCKQFFFDIARGLFFGHEVNNKTVSVDELSRDYALLHECRNCLVNDADTCNIRQVCSRYNISVIDYKAGFNEALRIIIKNTNE